MSGVMGIIFAKFHDRSIDRLVRQSQFYSIVKEDVSKGVFHRDLIASRQSSSMYQLFLYLITFMVMNFSDYIYTYLKAKFSKRGRKKMLIRNNELNADLSNIK